MKKLLTLVLLFSFGCAPSGGGSSGSSSKSLFALWTATDNTFSFDITGKTYGSFPMLLTLASGEQCTMTATISGTESSGAYGLSGSTYVPSTGGGVDPGCASMNQSGNYTKSGSDLQFCSTSPTVSCKSYR
jgi:hypothetical protein